MIFRLLIELPLSWLIPIHTENFEVLAISSRLTFLAVGIGLLMALLNFIAPKNHDVSVSHLLDRMNNHQAKLPFKNWYVQFLGAVICLTTGQSADREGPVMHLGTGAASQFGQWLKLLNNSIRLNVARNET